MDLTVFDLFKIGIGPSSSHTVGPMVAANRFLDHIANQNAPGLGIESIVRLSVSLHGSLAFTGKGHATDRAILLGLCGEQAHTVDPEAISNIIAQVHQNNQVSPPGHPTYRFHPVKDLIFDYDLNLPGHANGMIFYAYDENQRIIAKKTYYSIGGGFVCEEGELNQEQVVEGPDKNLPHPFSSAQAMIERCEETGLTIAELMRKNTLAQLSLDSYASGMNAIWKAMKSSVERGLRQTGELPGGLGVKRRANKIHEQLEEARKSNQHNPLEANDWLQMYAMAVNEENAAGGKVVTAPTNGAAGVIPATMHYYFKFFGGQTQKNVETFLLTAAAIGALIKKNASISGAEVGCQGEVGSASAMAAAGLAALMGGNPKQIENAAEIALEHHLGMTCDPIGGLVQVPCIERNGMGAIKAVSAASLALKGDGSHFVPLDSCIETMRQTGLDMNSNYKETSKGGLAVNVVEC